MARITMSRWLGVLTVVGFGAVLGACGATKQEQALIDENKDLRTKLGDIENRTTALEGNVGTLSSQIAKTPPPTLNEPDRFPPKPPSGGGSERRIDMGDSLFASGSDVLSANAKKSVDGAIRGVNKGASLRVEGFSDSKPITKSKWASNEALSQARADAVRKYLSSKGYGSVDAIGYGAVSRNGKSPSRRVEIVVVE